MKHGKNMTALLFLLSFSIFLPACQNIQTSTPESTASQPSAVLPAPSSESAPEKNYTQTEIDNFVQQTMEAETQKESFLSPTAQKDLELHGLKARVKNVQITSKTAYTFDLVLHSAHAERTFPIVASCSYRLFLEGEKEPGINYNTQWGGLSVLKDGTLVLSTLNKLQFLNPETLAEVPSPFDISSFALRDVHYLSVASNEKLGYVASLHLEGNDALAFFAPNGQLEEVVTLPADEYGNQVFSQTLQKIDYGVNKVLRCHTLEYLNLDSPSVMLHSPTGEVLLFSKDEKLLYPSAPLLDYQQGTIGIQLYRFDSLPGSMPQPDKQHQSLALYRENGQVTQFVFFDGSEIHPSWCKSFQEGDAPHQEKEFTLDANKKLFSAYDYFTGLMVTLDFSAHKAAMDYSISLSNIDFEAPADVSPNEQSQLLYASRDGAGDVSYASLILYDTKTQSANFIRIVGGMYGFGGAIQFLDDERFYVMSENGVDFYDTKNGKKLPLTLELQLEMPNGSTKKRRLFSLAYDAEKDRFAALYAELEENMEWEDYAKNNYSVALLNGDGRLKELFATQIPLGVGDFNLEYPESTYQNNKISFTGTSFLQGKLVKQNYTIYTDNRTVKRERVLSEQQAKPVPSAAS